MIYLWAEVQETWYERNRLKNFKAHLVMAKDVQDRTDVVFRSIFKHHCTRVAKFISLSTGGITKNDMDEAAFNPYYDKSVEEILNDRRDSAARLCSSSVS